MTKEEAIERLKTDIFKYADFTENPNENEFWMAFDMAIKALEQQPCIDKLISKLEDEKFKLYDDDIHSGFDGGLERAKQIVKEFYEVSP